MQDIQPDTSTVPAIFTTKPETMNGFTAVRFVEQP